MKAKTPPTSPKYKVKEIEKLYKDDKMKIERPQQAKSNFIMIAIIALIIGLLAGFLGHTLFNYLEINYPERFSFQNQNTNQNTVSSEDEKSSLYSELIEKVNPSIVDIYLKKEKTENSLEGVYLKNERKGMGLVLSSDGYILTTENVISDKTSQYVIITNEQKVYDVADIYEDPSTSFVFLKASEADNLKVAQTVDFNNFSIGTDVYALNSNSASAEKSVLRTKISSFTYKDINNPEDLEKSSEELSRYVSTNLGLENDWEGAPLADSDGRIIGIYFQQDDYHNSFIPIEYIINLVNDLLKEKEVIRVNLGLRYIDLSRAVNISEALSQEMQKGVLIYSSGGASVIDGSPAEKAGLSEGDIIIEVEGTDINQDSDFSELIQNINIGKTAIFRVIREGIEREIEVTLEKY